MDRILYEDDIVEILAKHLNCSVDDINIHSLDCGYHFVALVDEKVFKKKDAELIK